MSKAKAKRQPATVATAEAKCHSDQRLVRHTETMDIYTPRGSKVIMNDPTAGYPRDAKTISDKGLVEGSEYTVQCTDVHGYHTYLYLVEYPGIAFNTVNFCNVPNDKVQP